MEHALPRTWSLCMTSENHGTVGPAGCTFSHAPEKHERVLAVEAPAGAHAPVAEFKGYVDGEPTVTWFDRDNMPRVGTKLFAHAAANKAAEEGELPPTLNDLARLFADAYENRKEVTLSSESCEKLFLSMTTSPEADRASRRVANKAEVEPVLGTWPKRIWLQAGDTDTRDDYQTVRHLGDGITWADNEIDRFDVEYVRADLATPPATTGARNARDEALEEAAALVEGCDKRASLRGISIAIRALKGSVGASTVLTDERITHIANEFCWPAPGTVRAFARAIERDVAVQAGQVAVPEDWRANCESLIDIWDDAQNNPPESRCYLEGAWPAMIEEIRTALSAPSPAKESK